jgi:putative DNA primase/helicase
MSKIDSAQVKAEARGKWPSILRTLGVSDTFLVNRLGPCPMCQDGRTRFRFDDKDGAGTWFCHHCPKQSGDGFALVMGVNGWTFPKALEEVAALVGSARPIKIRQGPDVAEVRAEMERMWKAAMPLHMVEEAADWWRNRIGRVPTLTTVRATPALRCPGAGVFPAMLSIIQGADGKAVNLHRTFLAAGGLKADVEEPRRVMALPMPKGCAVRLYKPGEVLGIAEGIETAVAASELTGVPVWSALNTTTLEAWEPPAGVRVIVFGDNDGNFAGQSAAFNLAKRLRRERFEVEVRLPPAPGMDWNDVWNAQREMEPANVNVAA